MAEPAGEVILKPSEVAVRKVSGVINVGLALVPFHMGRGADLVQNIHDFCVVPGSRALCERLKLDRFALYFKLNWVGQWMKRHRVARFLRVFGPNSKGELFFKPLTNRFQGSGRGVVAKQRAGYVTNQFDLDAHLLAL